MADCGTEVGYQAHLRRDELACDRCMAANALAQTNRRRRRRGLPAYEPLPMEATDAAVRAVIDAFVEQVGRKPGLGELEYGLRAVARAILG